MDTDVFEQFIEQLQRYVRERLIPAEKEILETETIPEAIVSEMRDMGLFGLTMPEEYGGAGMNIQQYIRTVRELSYAMPLLSVYHVDQHRHGKFGIQERRDRRAKG